MPQYFAAQEGAGRRALRDQPDRLGRAQGRRAAALDPPRGPRPPSARQRLPALARLGPCISPGRHPRGDRDRRAARARGEARGERGQGLVLLRRPGPPGTWRSRAASASTVYLGGHMPAETFGEILDLARSFGPDVWKELARDSSSPSRTSSTSSSGPGDRARRTRVSCARTSESRRQRRTDLRVPLKYRVSRRLHESVFRERRAAFPRRARFTGASRRRSRPVRRTAHALEQAAVPLFGVVDCG